ncbi:hypothetical protein IEQ34_013637 [Dendrobium chrysotoxum]|uniref:Ubiquitin-like protease family profile domain-containing protein n=1 Tax=Dendrobium chrysotoxum TaxID=161865 RepID=A0AAV7GPR5_DENCH|nr:hypothetical protein IEQ34_013637 [Dendrobium chrysotoxum]
MRILAGISRYYRGITRNDMIYASGHIFIYRSQIDELLMSEYLDNIHVNTFGIFLVEKNQMCPGLYLPFLFVSNLHWGYKVFNVDTKKFVSHINKESVNAANLILVPIIENSHWTLLVGNLKNKVWDFYDSLPKKTHRAILPEVISHLYEDTTTSFATDIRRWRIRKIKQVPTQKNSVDCGMYVCKYMEAVIQPEAVVWVDVKDWKDNMAKFMTEFAYAILSTIIK